MAKIMDESAVNRAVARVAHEIMEHNKGADNVVLVGIQRRGVSLAKMLAEKIELFEQVKIPVGILDIAFYRDDIALTNSQPVVNNTKIDFDINDKHVVMVDDVLYTGRTARAAMDALIDLGRPRTIQLAILVDRGHRELPIVADYVGKNVPTSRDEEVQVHVKEYDGIDEVLIKKR